MRLQKGHILCDPRPGVGLRVPISRERRSAMLASLLRRRSRNRPNVIDSPAIFLLFRRLSRSEIQMTRAAVEKRFATFLQVNHDRPRAEMLCRIAHNPPETSGIARLGELQFSRLEMSNSDQLLLWA